MHATMREALRQRGLTAEQAARAMDYHPVYIRRVLAGGYPVSLKLARRFARLCPDWEPVARSVYGATFDGKPAHLFPETQKIPAAS